MLLNFSFSKWKKKHTHKLPVYLSLSYTPLQCVHKHTCTFSSCCKLNHFKFAFCIINDLITLGENVRWCLLNAIDDCLHFINVYLCAARVHRLMPYEICAQKHLSCVNSDYSPVYAKYFAFYWQLSMLYLIQASHYYIRHRTLHLTFRRCVCVFIRASFPLLLWRYPCHFHVI